MTIHSGTRWNLDYYTENGSSYYQPAVSFWQASIGTAARYNKTTFSPRVSSWTAVEDGVLHVIHYDWWGNWQWRLNRIGPNQTLHFAEGGWQDAHGGPVNHNYFYVGQCRRVYIPDRLGFLCYDMVILCVSVSFRQWEVRTCRPSAAWCNVLL